MFVNIVVEFDGSDVGVSFDEVVFWGKIKKIVKFVKVSRRCLFILK